MVPHRLRAPASDGGLLAEPPLSEAQAELAANQGRLATWNHDFQGRPFSWLRSEARRLAVEQSKAHLGRFGLDLPPQADEGVPWVVTGHQPELFHPGVWVKNFAAASVAHEVGGLALNLIVDDDIPKAASIRVPSLVNGSLKTTSVAFDDWTQEFPYEDWSQREESLFASFPDRVVETLSGQVADPAIRALAPHLARAAQVSSRIGLRFAAARRGLESDWGVRNWEVPLGAVCESEPFLWFLSHILANLGRFRAVHNAALARYRKLYQIRSKHHPVPALGEDGDWLEAPFWAWRKDEPRRRPLLARQLRESIQLRIYGENEPFIELPLGPDREACCAVEELRELPARGIRLRTRALTTTMFARFFLGDLFIHGIGGAKYDELGDEVARGFLEIEPPHYLTLSLTLWAGLDSGVASIEAFRAVNHQLRDLEFNPDRHIQGVGSETIAAKQRAIQGPTDTRRQRVARFQEIRRCNDLLQGYVTAERARLRTERDEIEAGLKRAAVARSREYPFVVHSIARLQAAFRAVAPGAFSALAPDHF